MADAESREDAVAKTATAAALIAVAQSIRSVIDERPNEALLPLWFITDRMLADADRLLKESSAIIAQT